MFILVHSSSLQGCVSVFHPLFVLPKIGDKMVISDTCNQELLYDHLVLLFSTVIYEFLFIIHLTLDENVFSLTARELAIDTKARHACLFCHSSPLRSFPNHSKENLLEHFRGDVEGNGSNAHGKRDDVDDDAEDGYNRHDV